LCLGEFPCAVVELPEPWFITGAYFVALILKVPVAQIDPQDRNAPLDYFTLEKTVSIERGPPTVLCGWTKEGTHVNYGIGLEPTLAAFVEELERRVTEQADEKCPDQ
jgi:hypothetical protein